MPKELKDPRSLSAWIYGSDGFLSIVLSTGTQRALMRFESGTKMEAQALTSARSPFLPVAIECFGLGIGYFIWSGLGSI